jgi:hypothetical protein
MMLAVGLSYIAFTMLRYIPSVPSFLRAFIMKCCFLETYNHPKLNQEDINHLNRSITQKEIEPAIRVSKKRKVQDLMDSLLNSIRRLKN